MCQKKIRTNIVDNNPDYLCCSHSKIHIPKKRSFIKESLIQYHNEKSFINKYINKKI
jgi:hypothetical protein